VIPLDLRENLLAFSACTAFVLLAFVARRFVR
jgi:hypothetical protein